MKQYKIQNNQAGNASAVINIENNSSIPFDPDNSDYQAYLKFLAEGGQPLPADSE
jgi:hypothetical protein